MSATRSWVLAGAAAVVAAGFGAGFTASADDAPLNDVHRAPAAQLTADHAGAQGGAGPAVQDDSPESADSPAESPVDSANSANTPNTPDTPADDGPDTPAQSANSPADDD